MTKKIFFDIIILEKYKGESRMILAFILWIIIVIRSWCDNLEKYKCEPRGSQIAVVGILLLAAPLLEAVGAVEYILNLIVRRDDDDDEDSNDSSG